MYFLHECLDIQFFVVSSVAICILLPQIPDLKIIHLPYSLSELNYNANQLHSGIRGKGSIEIFLLTRCDLSCGPEM